MTRPWNSWNPKRLLEYIWPWSKLARWPVEMKKSSKKARGGPWKRHLLIWNYTALPAHSSFSLIFSRPKISSPPHSFSHHLSYPPLSLRFRFPTRKQPPFTNSNDWRLRWGDETWQEQMNRTYESFSWQSGRNSTYTKNRGTRGMKHYITFKSRKYALLFAHGWNKIINRWCLISKVIQGS